MLGNLTQLIARDAEEFQRHVATDYGPVTKLNGFFGVRVLNFQHATTRVRVTGATGTNPLRIRPQGTPQHSDQG